MGTDNAADIESIPDLQSAMGPPAPAPAPAPEPIVSILDTNPDKVAGHVDDITSL